MTENPKQDGKRDLPTKADGLIPHNKPMIQIDTLLKVGENSGGMTETVLNENDNIFIDKKGNLDGCVHVELMAQSVAAIEGFKHLDDPNYSPEGLLAEVKNLKIIRKASLKDTLKIRISKRAELGAISLFTGKISCNQKLVAEADIKIFDTSAQ